MRVLDLRTPELQQKLNTDPCSLLFYLAKSFAGENVILDLGHMQITIVQLGDDAKSILVDNEAYFRKNYGSFNALLGQSRLTSDDPPWQSLQRLSQPHIAKVSAADIHSLCEHYYGKVIAKILSVKKDNIIDIAPWLDEAAARILFQLLFNIPLEQFGENLIEDFQSILRFANRFNWNKVHQDHLADPENLELIRIKYRRVSKAISDWLIHEPFPKTDALNFLGMLRRNIGNADAVSEIVSLAFAGYDTSSTSIGWALFLLSVQPDIYEALGEELETFGEITPERLNEFYRLPLLDHFFREALRIFPPVPMLSRITRKSIEINHASYNEGHVLLISIIGIHYNKNRYENPSQVNLNRWIEKEEGSVDYLPFGMGRRRCGGALFGEREFKSALACLIRALKFEPIGNEYIAFDYIGTLRRQGGQRFIIRPSQEKKGPIQ